MSMILNLRRLSRADEVFLRRNPGKILDFLDQKETTVSGLEPNVFWARLFPKKAANKPSSVEIPGSREIDLDKAWHGLHYLFTQTDWEGELPACYLVKGGKTVGQVDVGYGPARMLSAIEVEDFGIYLDQISEETLRKRFDPDLMAELEIYPNVWQDEGEEAFEYLLSHFNPLRSFVRMARQDQNAMLVFLT